MAKRFRKRQVEVEAVFWTGKNREEVAALLDPIVPTFHGPVLTADGIPAGCLPQNWWLIRDPADGSIDSLRPEIFADTYEAAQQHPVQVEGADPGRISLAGLELIAGALLDPGRFVERSMLPDPPSEALQPEHMTSWQMRAIRVAFGIDAAAAQMHKMIPGSHERAGGPECYCGAAWSRLDDCCAAPQPEQEKEPGGDGLGRRARVRLEDAALILDQLAEKAPEGSLERSDRRHEADAVRDVLKRLAPAEPGGGGDR